MAEQKTRPTVQPVEDFLNGIADERLRQDCFAVLKLMKKVTGAKPNMWGPGIVGFGQYHYKYESGHEGDMCLTGFAPRKPNILTLYVLAGFPGQTELLEKLGKHKTGKGCLYLKKLEDVDQDVLAKLISGSVEYLKKKYPGI
ncbi:MAG: DUF1801 domain-containing protein [Chitinophagaceae bacterium]